jgi:hypothetical protein
MSEMKYPVMLEMNGERISITKIEENILGRFRENPNSLSSDDSEVRAFSLDQPQFR